MYRTLNFRPPARRSAAIGAAVALAAGGALAVAPAAHATTYSGGTSTATVLRAGLDVSLLNNTIDVPVNVSLNDVKAPADAKETALTVTVGHGVESNHAVDIVRAEVATANATVERDKAEGYANIASAQVHVPGLPLLSLVKLDAITSKATCQVGHKPTASSQLVGITVLGQHVSLSAVGTTDLNVPGVGRVSLDLTKTVTTSTTAAATALHLKVYINPLNLGVAEVSGDVTLAQATCRTPKASGSTGGSTGGSTSGGSSNGGSTSGGSTSGGSTSGSSNGGSSNGGSTSGGSTSGSTSGGSSTSGSTSGSTGGSSTGGSSSGSTSGTSGGGSSSGSGGATGSGTGTDTSTQTVGDSGNLAETGASSATPYIAIGAAALVAAGAATYLATNRRRKSHPADGPDSES